jgi:NAD(P)-dependent dehydrogenase (short-subunit alcohol dehydrogenase family)
MKSVLITGANRGIGLSIVKQLISSSLGVELIFAGYRDPNKSKVIFVKVNISGKSIYII